MEFIDINGNTIKSSLYKGKIYFQTRDNLTKKVKRDYEILNSRGAIGEKS
tara:strand:+ start:1101 stop:1250 length:150 start_codon:yes stop_codon:yes gene_type:complete